MKYRNVSPLGALDFPLVGRVVEAGEVVEVPDDVAHLIEGQTAVWQPLLGEPEPEGEDE